MRSVFTGRCEVSDVAGVRLKTGDRPTTRQGDGRERGNEETERTSMAQNNRWDTGTHGDTSFGPVGEQDDEGRTKRDPKANEGRMSFPARSVQNIRNKNGKHLARMRLI